MTAQAMLALFLADEIKAARTPNGTVTIELAEQLSPITASLHVRDRAEADALVKAALAARDLLPEAEPVKPGCGARHPEMPWFRCTEPAGHDGGHVADGSAPDGEPQVTWPQDKLPPYTEPPGVAHCAPGDCICGAHVSADGTVTPAGAR